MKDYVGVKVWEANTTIFDRKSPDLKLGFIIKGKIKVPKLGEPIKILGVRYEIINAKYHKDTEQTYILVKGK